MNNGYADFSINSVDTELSPKKDAFVITFSISEGQKYAYGKFDITSAIPEMKLDALRSLIKMKPNQSFNASELENTVEEITNYLGDHGYAFVDVDFDVNKDSATKITDITFNISESRKLYVNRIDIKENTRTLDKVIRREFRINEGDPYNQSKLMRSKQRIQNLGYFNNVNFKNTPSEFPDKVNVEVEVEEKPTGSINVGVGYSTTDGALGSIKAAENNFLGRGQEVEVGVSKAKRTTNIDFSFTEPRFMDMPLAAGFDLFIDTTNKSKNQNYQTKTIGGRLRLTYDLTENLSHNLHYMLKKENISKVPDDASRFVKQEVGRHSTSLIGHTLTYNRLDSDFAPSSGYVLQATQDLAGVGGNTKYIRHDINAKKYFPIYKKDVILGLFAKAGNIHGLGKKKVRLSDRYFIGSEQFRGFDSSGIGPRDKQDGESLGGTSFYTLTAELNFPVGLPKEMGVKGAAFVDAGSLFGTPLKGADRDTIYHDRFMRASYGVGIIWDSRFAQIRLDYAIPFKKKRYDDAQKFRVQLGTGF